MFIGEEIGTYTSKNRQNVDFFHKFVLDGRIICTIF